MSSASPAYADAGSDQLPANVNDFAALGEQDFTAGRYGDAAKDWQHAILDDPQNGGLHLLLGQALFATGHYDEAAGATQVAMHLLPQDQWGTVVTSYRELYPPNRDYHAQLSALETAIKGHDSPAARFLLGFQYGYLGHPKESVRQLDQALKLNPKDEMAQKLRGIMAAKLGDATAAPVLTPAS
jgi:tetratricopeptide (TPR) repeat protein